MALARISIGSSFDPKGLKDAQKELGDFSEKSGRQFGDLAKKAGLLFLGIGAGAAVLGKKLLEAGEAASTSNARIEQVAESMNMFGEEFTGYADGVDRVTDRLVNLAEATARATGIDQNSIKQVQATLLTFREIGQSADEAGSEFDRATQAAIDLAAAGFGSAETNAIQLGKALNDPIKGLTALSRSGVTFTEAEKERIKALVESNEMGTAQSLILAAIEQQVGGTAEATANASDRMRVGFSQLQERLGQKLLPVFEKVVNFLLEKVIPAIDRIVEAFGEGGLGGIFRLFFNTANKEGPKVADAIAGFFTRAFDWVTNKGLPMLLDGIGKLASALIDWIAPLIIPFVKAYANLYITAWTWIITEGLPLLLEKLRVLGAAIVDWVQPRIGPFLQELGAFIAAGGQWILYEGLPRLAERLSQLGEQLAAWIGPRIGPMLEELGKFLGAALQWIVGTGIPLLVEKLTQLGLELWKWILPTLPKVLKQLGGWMAGIGVWMFTEGWPAFIKFGLGLGSSLIDGLVEAIKKLAGVLFQVGKDIVGEIGKGIAANAGSLQSQILGLVPGAGAISNIVGGISNLLPFYKGGLVPGAPNMPVPIMAHGGEYVLSADVVDAIRRGGPSRGLDPVAVPATGPTINQGPAVVIENYTAVERQDDEMLIGMLEFAVRGGRL